MGAKNCPETPRQKMIAMMYLVLTALLALNVSKDILNAFVIVNDSIMETNRIFKGKVESNYKTFEQAMAIMPDKVRDAYEKAKIVKQEADKLVALIETMKYEVVAECEGLTPEEVKKMEEEMLKSNKPFLAEISSKDNYDTPTHYFFKGCDEVKGEGNCKVFQLKTAIINFKKKMEELLGKYKDRVSLGLNVEKEFPTVEGDRTASWQITNFYHTILAANVVLLNKLILEVRNAEADVVGMLYASVDLEGFSFDKVGAKVIAQSNYVLQGEKYRAEIFVAAYDSRQQPKIIIGSDVDTVNLQVIGDQQVIEGKDGYGIYEVQAAGLGERKYGGIIEIISKNGQVMKYPFRSSYFVAAPSATVSPEKMNVFYIGVDNPVSVSVPGVPNEKVRVSISNGSMISQGSGKYIVRVSGGTESVITVSAELGSGTVRQMGVAKFRVKKLPTPKPYIAGKPGGNYSKAEVLASPYVTAVMENFDFDIRYDVISYTFTYKNPAGDLIDIQGVGYQMTSDMKTKIQNAKKGERFWFDNITAKGPDGTKNLGSVIIRITN
ncbi:MAG: hypothetical protein N2Z72_06740 [Bacteroidales bacterium]|nr:hypothetical protein [Bacteroidales bacterium]